MGSKFHISEKEAIARGWIEAPEPDEEVEPPQQATSGGFAGMMIFIAGWLVGFVCGLAFIH